MKRLLIVTAAAWDKPAARGLSAVTAPVWRLICCTTLASAALGDSSPPITYSIPLSAATAG